MLPQGQGHYKSMCELLLALDVLILEREENHNTLRKILEAQERSTTGTQLMSEPHQLCFSGERHNALQGRINFHLPGGVQIFPGGVHWCATKELARLGSSFVTVVSYDLVISHTKL